MKKYKLFLLIRSSKTTVAKKELKLETVVKPDLLKKFKTHAGYGYRSI